MTHSGRGSQELDDGFLVIVACSTGVEDEVSLEAVGRIGSALFTEVMV